MRALTVRPGEKESLEVRDVPDPVPAAGELLVQDLAVGVCGTDKEIARGEYGWAPPEREWLVLGHESRRRPAAGSRPVTLSLGVRRPDPEPCGPAHAESSTCAAMAATPNAVSTTAPPGPGDTPQVIRSTGGHSHAGPGDQRPPCGAAENITGAGPAVSRRSRRLSPFDAEEAGAC